MKQLIDEVIELQTAITAFYRRLHAPVPAPPASEAELARLDAFFHAKDLATPRSLREALAAYDGVEHLFAEKVGLRSVRDIVERTFEPIPEAVEEFPTVTEIIIGGGVTEEFMGLDLAQVGTDGEIGVVNVAFGFDTDAAPSLRAYLEALRDALRENLAQERADRNVLPEN